MISKKISRLKRTSAVKRKLRRPIKQSAVKKRLARRLPSVHGKNKKSVSKKAGRQNLFGGKGKSANMAGFLFDRPVPEHQAKTQADSNPFELALKKIVFEPPKKPVEPKIKNKPEKSSVVSEQQKIITSLGLQETQLSEKTLRKVNYLVELRKELNEQKSLGAKASSARKFNLEMQIEQAERELGLRTH